MNRDEMTAYVRTLSPEVQALFTAAERIALETDDTLSEEFQLAASIVDVFTARGAAWHEK